jgi:hypothetical protein
MSINVQNQFVHRLAIADKALRDFKASLFVYMITPPIHPRRTGSL